MTIACGNTELNNEDIRFNTEFQMENHSKEYQMNGPIITK